MSRRRVSTSVWSALRSGAKTDEVSPHRNVCNNNLDGENKSFLHESYDIPGAEHRQTTGNLVPCTEIARASRIGDASGFRPCWKMYAVSYCTFVGLPTLLRRLALMATRVAPMDHHIRERTRATYTEPSDVQSVTYVTGGSIP
jgi:hypothetical protein